MKHLLSTLILALGSCMFSCPIQAAGYDWGEPDTVAHYSIGPGMVYSHIKYYKKVINVHIIRIDLNNPLNTVEMYPSNGKTPDLKREIVTDQCENNSWEGHKAVGGINHDLFYYTGTAICAGINARNGEIVSNYPNWGRSLLTINTDKLAEVFPPKYQASVTLPNSSKITIDNVNESALGVLSSRNCVLFNTMSSLTLSQAGTYVKIRPIDPWIINGASTRCVVEQVGTTVIQPDGKSHILFLRNASATTFTSGCGIGDTLKIDQYFVPTTFNNSGLTATPAQNIKQALHGWPLVIFNGELHPNEWNDFVDPGRENRDYPCTQSGISRDGKQLSMITVDKATMLEIAYYLRDHGAYNVVNFDGGGSALMSINNVLVNNPADGTERQVMDSFQAISLAPSDNTLTSMSFSCPSVKIVETTMLPLRLIGNNQYGEVVTENLTGAIYSCDPALGYVDQDGVFHASKGAKMGYITAQKGGMSCQLRVTVEPVGTIKVIPTKLLVDNRREALIHMETLFGLKTLIIDPAQYNWSVADPEICTISNGKIKGLKNGTTTITCGSFDPITLTVEIGLDERTIMTYPQSTSVITQSGFSNLLLSNTNLPDGWTSGQKLSCNFISSRAPFIEVGDAVTFYGIPDSISWEQYVPSGLFKEMYVYLTSNTSDKFQSYTFSPKGNQTQRISIPFAQGDTAWSVTEFPITLSRVKYACETSAPKQSYEIGWKNLTAYYPEKSPLGLDEKQMDRFNAWVASQRDEATLTFTLGDGGACEVTLLTLDGRVLSVPYSGVLASGEHRVRWSTSSLGDAIYIIRLSTQEGQVHLKWRK